MRKGLFAGIFCVALVLVVAGQLAAQPTLRGDRTEPPNAGSPGGGGEALETLFQGDFGPEIGLGCSNATGNSGGPNDIFVGVTATLTPPYGIISHTYNVFTQISPNITSLTFQARAGGGTPGAVMASQTGMPWTQGNHTVAIAPPMVINSSQFYIGHAQVQSTVGMRWGLDTSTSAGTSYIQAASCGANVFTLVDTLGFPGNWVMAAVVDDTIPVELMNFTID